MLQASATSPAIRWYDRRRAGVVLAVVLGVVAAAVFAAGIRTPWPWSDEGATYLALLRTWPQLLVLYHGPDAPMVPYYVLAKAWTAAVQAIAPGVPVLVAVRLLSAAAATLTVVALYALVARNAGRLAGLLAGLMLVSLPGFDRYAQEARTYTLLALAATVSWLLLDVWQRPVMRPTLTSSAPGALPAPSRRHRVLVAAGYVLSLAAVPAVHTFGLFQWPAHAVAGLIEAGPARRRWRRLLVLALLMGIAAALAVWQVVPSMMFGTGPPGPTARREVDAVTIAGQLTHAITMTTDLGVLAPVAILSLLGVVLSLGRRTRLFTLRLVVWLVVPLALELYLGSVRTNLFRLRYWIAFLPALAALAGLGAARLATLAAHVAGRLTRWAPGARLLQAATVLAGAAAIAAVQLQAALPAQQLVRSPDGHAQDLSAVLAGVDRARALDPTEPVLISNHSASGMLAAAEPSLIANPLLQLQPAVPTVYTTPVPTGEAVQELTGARDLLWIYKGTTSARGALRRLPPSLVPLHLRVLDALPAGPGWTLVELARPTASTRPTAFTL